MNSEISAVFQNTLSANKSDREKGKKPIFNFVNK